MSNGLGEQQAKRVAKAINESGEWVWTKTPYGSWVVTTSGGTYEVNQNVCMCPDHKHNCSGTEMRCKHTTALRMKLLAEQTSFEVAKPESAQRTQQEEDALFDRIFGA